MSDFYSIDLDDKVEKFQWESIEAKGDSPGPRSKHALIGAKNKIYLVGGLYNDIHSSSEIFEFDADKRHWTLLKPSGDKLPEIDSFGCVYIASGDEEKMSVGAQPDERHPRQIVRARHVTTCVVLSRYPRLGLGETIAL